MYVFGVHFLVFILICISADFDPVHKGHEKLISEARKIADRESKKLVVYLNKGFSANHAPFFTSFEARSEMALALGADDYITKPFNVEMLRVRVKKFIISA